MPIDFHTTTWPVVFIKVDGDSSPDDFERYIAAFNRFYEKKERFAIVSYLKQYKSRPEFATRIGKWIKETEPLIKQYWSSNAMVSESGGFRFLLSAVFLVKPLPIPYKVCANGVEAIAFTKAHWNTRPPLPATVKWPY